MKNLIHSYKPFNVVLAIFFIVFFSASIHVLFANEVLTTAVAILLAIASFAPYHLPKNSLFDMVYRHAYTGEMRTFVSDAEKDTFLDGIRDYSQFVTSVGNEAQVIHIAYMGVMPDVLINNTTYPIATQDLAIDDLTITLDKFQTKRTPITDDELYAATASKREGAIKLHGMAIQINKIKKALHSFAPSGNTADMPVLVSTGADDGTGRKRLLWEDVQRLKQELDNREVPEEVRRLVLCSDHVNDLTLIDQKFKDAYYNRQTGKVYSQLGFDVRDHLSAPYFNYSTKAKLAFGGTPTADHFKATVFFRTDQAAKATGWIKMYADVADTANQTAFMNWRHYFIALPLMTKGRAAIVSGKVA